MEKNGLFNAHCGRHHKYIGGLTSHSWQTYQIAMRLNASPDKAPFRYSDIKVYSDWEKWNNYGYAVCKQYNGWKLVKVTQFPKPNYEVIREGFPSAEEAMKSVGIDDSEKYLTKGMIN